MKFIRMYIGIINTIFGSVYPGFANEGGWLGELISAGGAVLSAALGGDSGSKGTSGEIKNNTVSSSNIADKDVLYRDQAVYEMDQMANILSQYSQQDRNFIESSYRPFQQSLMQSNQNLLPVIERVAGATLEQNAKDLLGNEALKGVLRNQATNGNSDIKNAYDSLTQQLSKIPTTEERVGQALTDVESQFKGAGRELARDFASRGQTVSQASRRDLAFEKAKAKAGVAGQAAEASRAEQIGAKQLGLAAAETAGQSQLQLQTGAINSLATLQSAQQAGLATPQIGGVNNPGAGLDAANIEAGVRTAAGLQTFGSRASSDEVTTTKKGIKPPVFTSGATGSQSPTGGLYQIAQPGTEKDRITLGLANPR